MDDSLFRRKPQKGSAAVLDDEASVTEQLVSDLASQAGVESHPVASFEELVELVEETHVDVASIDWELKGYGHGQLALRHLSKERPDVARIVYTKHEDSEPTRSRLAHGRISLKTS